MSNFATILDEAPTEVNRPKPLPSGTYLFVVKSLPRYDKSSKKGTDFVEFTLQPIQAENDVDEEALEACGGLVNKTMRLTFYLTEDAVYRLDEFHEHCGLDLSDETTRRERNEMVVNQQVMGFIKHRPTEDGSRIYAEISRTFAVE